MTITWTSGKMVGLVAQRVSAEPNDRYDEGERHIPLAESERRFECFGHRFESRLQISRSRRTGLGFFGFLPQATPRLACREFQT